MTENKTLSHARNTNNGKGNGSFVYARKYTLEQNNFKQGGGK
jgi:hypothetical protein